MRYGGIFRGLKVKGAQELGAAGVLIFSDPSDDGAAREDNGYLAYPYGPARNPTSVQRGSVQYLSLYPGDPTTPGYPAYENSTRTKGENMPEIPSLPLSWANAQVLLNEISEGGLNRAVSLVNHVDTRPIPIWNTMGVIPGYIKDEIVVVGNHRDGKSPVGVILASSKHSYQDSLGYGCNRPFVGHCVHTRIRTRTGRPFQEGVETSEDPRHR